MRVDGRPITEDKKSSDGKIVHNIFILDCSGSMYPQKYPVALKGINDEIKELKENKHVIFTQSVVEFGSRSQILYTRWFERDCKFVDHRQQLGMTALNEAIYKTLTRALADKSKEDRVLVKIFTDGGENDSTYNYNHVKELIKECEKNLFTITFVGTEYDTKAAIGHYNLSVENTLTHDNTVESIEKMNLTRSFATEVYSKSVANGMKVSASFYSKSVIEDSQK